MAKRTCLDDAWAGGNHFVWFTRTGIERMPVEWQARFSAIFAEFMSAVDTPPLHMHAEMFVECDDATAAAIERSAGIVLEPITDHVGGSGVALATSSYDRVAQA